MTRAKYLQNADLVQDVIIAAGDEGVLLVDLPALTGISYWEGQQAAQYLRIRKLVHSKRCGKLLRYFDGPRHKVWEPKKQPIVVPDHSPG